MICGSNRKFYLYWSNNLRNKPGKKMHLMADKDNHLINLFLEIQSSCSLILDKWLYGRSLFTPSQNWEQQTFLKDATFTYERLRDFRENCCAYKALYFSCQFITKSQNLSRVKKISKVQILKREATAFACFWFLNNFPRFFSAFQTWKPHQTMKLNVIKNIIVIHTWIK